MRDWPPEGVCAREIRGSAGQAAHRWAACMHGVALSWAGGGGWGDGGGVIAHVAHEGGERQHVGEAGDRGNQRADHHPHGAHLGEQLEDAREPERLDALGIDAGHKADPARPYHDAVQHVPRVTPEAPPTVGGEPHKQVHGEDHREHGVRGVDEGVRAALGPTLGLGTARLDRVGEGEHQRVGQDGAHGQRLPRRRLLQPVDRPARARVPRHRGGELLLAVALRLEPVQLLLPPLLRELPLELDRPPAMGVHHSAIISQPGVLDALLALPDCPPAHRQRPGATGADFGGDRCLGRRKTSADVGLDPLPHHRAAAAAAAAATAAAGEL
jgi:hypothetical protein